METKKKHELSLAKRMAISLVCGLVAGLAFMFLREHLNASGQAQTWTTINNLLFQDITAEGAERSFGIFYIIGQLFIKALQLVIIPMVFTSISLAIGSIADTRTMGRISAKTLFWFLLCSFLALLLAGCVGYGTYSMGLFNTRIEGLAEASGSTGSNPLNVVLNIIPSNIITAFGSNGAVLSSVFLAVAIGLSMNTLGESRTATLRRLLGEVNDVVVVFLNFIVSNFAPFAVFVLLTRTFAIYGIDYLKPALESEKLEARILRDLEQYQNRSMENALVDLLPRSMIPVVLRRLDISPEMQANSLTKQKRRALVELLKAFPIDITGKRPVSEAIITSGGVKVSEIDPKTMESKLLPGLFFAGELLDVDAYTGGYNLQIAFCTAQAFANNL